MPESKMPDGNIPVSARVKLSPPAGPSAGPYRAGPPPQFGDRWRAGPVGRLMHDAVIEPAMNLAVLGAAGMDKAGALTGILPTPAAEPAMAGILGRWVEKPYQAMLQRNRNTPGYWEARRATNARQAADGGSGFRDQVLSPYAPAVSALRGLLEGGFDEMNARADARTEAMQAFDARHPGRAAAGNLLGAALPASTLHAAGKLARGANAAQRAARRDQPQTDIIRALVQEGADNAGGRRREQQR